MCGMLLVPPGILVLLGFRGHISRCPVLPRNEFWPFLGPLIFSMFLPPNEFWPFLDRSSQLTFHNFKIHGGVSRTCFWFHLEFWSCWATEEDSTGPWAGVRPKVSLVGDTKDHGLLADMNASNTQGGTVALSKSSAATVNRVNDSWFSRQTSQLVQRVLLPEAPKPSTTDGLETLAPVAPSSERPALFVVPHFRGCCGILNGVHQPFPDHDAPNQPNDFVDNPQT